MLHPPLPPIASTTPVPEAVIVEPRVNCVVTVKLALLVVALFVAGAQTLLVLNPVLSHPTSVPETDPPAAATFNVWLTGVAAATLLSPAWLAVIVVTPGALAMTFVPEIDATFVFALV